MMLLLWEDLEWLLYSLAGGGAAIAAWVIARLRRARDGYLHYGSNLGRPHPIPLTPLSAIVYWVTAGSPTFLSNTFGWSCDGSSTTGIWECTGPGSFTWAYGRDESIFILEGSAEIEYLGNKFLLKQGEATHFVAGTTANWVVAEKVRKAYLLHEPGRVVRKMRRLLGILGVDGGRRRLTVPSASRVPSQPR